MSAEHKPQVDELFGDDEIGMDAPPPGPGGGEGGGKKRGARFKLLLVLLVLVGLAAFWFVSSAHHEQYYLQVEGQTVKVERGYFFPVGAGAWGSSNPAYAPFRLPEGVTPQKSGAMSLEEIDATLYDVYVAVAQKNLKDVRMGDPDVAEEMLRRANKLSSSSVAADRKLQQMRGDISFHRGLKEVRGIQTRFDLALEQFRAANRQGGDAFTKADAWVETIGRHRDEVRALVRESGLNPDDVLANPKPLLEEAAAQAAGQVDEAIQDAAEKKTDKPAAPAPRKPAQP